MEEKLKKLFKKFDRDGDGRISHNEFRAVFNDLGSDTSPEYVNRLISEMDTDGDGFIDLHEFTAFYGGCGFDSESEPKEIEDAFNLCDLDRNGLICAGELQAVMTSLGAKCTVKDCKKMIGSVDEDRDGSISFEEFKKLMSKSSKLKRTFGILFDPIY